MIVPSSLEDLDRVCELEQQFGAEAFSRRSLRRFILNESLVVFKDNSEYIIGYAIVLKRKNSHTSRLYSFIIDEKFRRKGVGFAYLSVLMHEEIYSDRMILEVYRGNFPALRMYQKAGFEVIKTIPNYYRDGMDALRMEKKLHLKK